MRSPAPASASTSVADRLGAEVGINADYFNINDTGAPLNVVMTNGRVLHQPDSAAALMVLQPGGVSMGPVTYSVTLSSKNVQLSIAHINEWSQSDDLAELTPEFGGTKAFGATEAILAPGSAPNTFTVTSIDRNLVELDRLQRGQLGIAAHGSAAQTIAGSLAPGDAVTIAPASQPPLSNASFAVGGGPMLLRDGQDVIDSAAPAPEESDVRNPVTAAGISADGHTLWLVVVDGRAPSRSIGLTRPQLASLLAALGASTAMAFDSGGSSEMAVRHLGELRTTVANMPSDGRERSIADGFFVVNSAVVGAPVQILLGPSRPVPAVLAGSSLQVQAYAVDANDQPVQVAPGALIYSVTPATATIGDDGMLVTQKPGPVTLLAAMGQVQGRLDLTVVPTIDVLSIAGRPGALTIAGKTQLQVNAATRDGVPIVVDPGRVEWRVESGPGRVDAGGSFVAGNVASRVVVSARVGGAIATTTVLVGDHTVMLQAAMSAGSTAGAYRYGSRPTGLPGGVDVASAPDGTAGLRLAYDFSTSTGTRAAYAQTSIPLPGQPSGLAIDVYGDANGEWLRGGYQNADGNDESVTVARHVDWRGWRTIRVDIPPQAAWPITWTRFYAVEPERNASDRGALWFRNFALVLPGPA